jgi:hypothetical protein
MSLSKYVVYIIILFATPFFFFNAIMAVSEYKQVFQLQKEGIKIKGVVDTVTHTETIDVGSTDYFVRLLNKDNTTIKSMVSLSPYESLYSVGDTVEVVYLPSHPEQGRINSNRELYLIGNQSLLESLPWIGIIILCLIFRKKITHLLSDYNQKASE